MGSSYKLTKSVSARRKIAGVCMVALAALNAWLGYSSGGYYITEWAIVALAVVLMLLVTVGLGLLGGARSHTGAFAVTLFLGYTSWTFISILWSANKGDAWYGSSLTLFYLISFWVAATLVAVGLPRRLTLKALSLGSGAVALLIVMTLASGATREGTFFLDGRLMGVAGYFNAQAAFLLVSFWVGIYIAGSRRINPVIRSLSLTSAVVCLEVALLTQSRGAAVAFIASLVVFFLFSGQRLRGFLAFAPVAVCAFLASPALNGVYLQLRNLQTVTGADLNAIERAETVILISAIAAGLYGLFWGLIDGRWRPARTLVRVAGVAVVVSVLVVGFIGGSLMVERTGNPVSWAGDQWTAFKTNDASGQESSRYMSASGSGRYALWQVAWNDFTENPVLGVGTHNYEATYYRDRSEAIGWLEQPHSLPLEILAERGLVGGVLFFGFLGTCVLSGLWRRFSSLNSEGKAQVGALLAAVTYWFVHSSAEWFWQIPAVTLPAVIYLAMLATPWKRPRDDEAIYAPSHRPLRLAGVGLAVLTLATVGPLYLSSHYQEKARSEENPWVALSEIERAGAFNPLDPEIARQRGDLAYRIGDIPLATRSYARAIELDPENYANYAVLGGVYEELGMQRRALALYEKSLRLNPLDDSLQENIDRLEQRASEG